MPVDVYEMTILAETFTRVERQRIREVAETIIQKSSPTSSWGRATRSALQRLIREAKLSNA